MGVKNYLIEGVSCSGKTTVCHALRQRGYQAHNCDETLAYQGDPDTGHTLNQPSFESDAERAYWQHSHHIWDVIKLKTMMADQIKPATFFCGGSRNFSTFIDLFDDAFILDIDCETLIERLAFRPENEFGGHDNERELIKQLHSTKRDIPTGGILIDATQPIESVVEQILLHCN